VERKKEGLIAEYFESFMLCKWVGNPFFDNVQKPVKFTEQRIPLLEFKKVNESIQFKLNQIKGGN
jgi:hypothetical protein